MCTCVNSKPPPIRAMTAIAFGALEEGCRVLTSAGVFLHNPAAPMTTSNSAIVLCSSTSRSRPLPKIGKLVQIQISKKEQKDPAEQQQRGPDPFQFPSVFGK